MADRVWRHQEILIGWETIHLPGHLLDRFVIFFKHLFSWITFVPFFNLFHALKSYLFIDVGSDPVLRHVSMYLLLHSKIIPQLMLCLLKFSQKLVPFFTKLSNRMIPSTPICFKLNEFSLGICWGLNLKKYLKSFVMHSFNFPQNTCCSVPQLLANLRVFDSLIIPELFGGV